MKVDSVGLTKRVKSSNTRASHVRIILVALDGYTLRRGEGKIDSPVQISSIVLGGNRRQEGANIERTSARSLLRPLSVMHDAMLLTLYAHRNNPIFLPRFRLHHLRLVVSPYRPRGPRPALALTLTLTDPPLVIYFHLFRPSDPALISFGLVAPCYDADGPRQYILLPLKMISRRRRANCVAGSVVVYTATGYT